MKKNQIILVLLSILSLTGCNHTKPTNIEFSLITPSGTPTLGLSEFIYNYQSQCQIVEGSDPLVASFTSSSDDIIVAPINLGAKLYTAGKSSYQLYETFVWGNLFLASQQEIVSFTDLDNQEVVVFSKNSTPDIIMQTLVNYYNINVTYSYVDDVATANSLLLTGQASYIVSAEPSISNLKAKKTIYTLDLQDEYSKATNVNSYPQAGIFVKKDRANDLKTLLQEMKQDINNTIASPSTNAKYATEISSTFATIGEAVLTSAIPNCHFGFSTSQKASIETYFLNMEKIGLSAAYGGSLPDENFYLNF